jgi:Ni,Fe-hydrogenase III large subunit/Ni,Fe-hydrogenase III component G
MNVAPLGLSAAALSAGVPAQRAQVSSGQLLTACRLAWENDGKLIALWASDERDRRRGFCIRVVVEDPDGLTVIEHTLPDADARYPDLTAIFPAANRMQRATYDLLGVAAESDDQRPWLWLASWPIDQFPLRRDFVASAQWDAGQEEYDFVKVEGDGVHEIPVGPVHAGVIEPGHFRFQVVGEKVLRLEERLGYTHKGIEKRFESLPILDGGRLAGRVSGDSTVAYAWAYAQALECIADVVPPPRAAWLRALCLERERLASHLGDLGALGNDGGFAFGLAQFSRLREDVLRINDKAFGHRLLMDVVVPGGVARDIAFEHVHAMHDEADRLAREVAALRAIYDEHAGLQDRFRTCGRVTPELAAKMGLLGLAGRASGRARDLRCNFPCAPYDALQVRIASQSAGDVWARFAVSFELLL